MIMAHPKHASDDATDPIRLKEPGEDPDYDAWFIEQVRIGIESADRGELIPHEQVMSEARALIARLARKAEDSV